MTIMKSGEAGFEGPDGIARANRAQARHALLVDAFRHVIADSTVLAVGAGETNWCTALAAAGALQVVGIERNPEIVARFRKLPDVGLRERIDLRLAEPLDELREEREAGRQHDVIILFDMLEGMTDLYALFGLLSDLGARLVIFDGFLSTSEEPVYSIERPREAITGERRPYLLPSRGAVAMVAYDMGFDLDWIDWQALDDDQRVGLSDYYAAGPRQRTSFTLIPEQFSE